MNQSRAENLLNKDNNNNSSLPQNTTENISSIPPRVFLGIFQRFLLGNPAANYARFRLVNFPIFILLFFFLKIHPRHFQKKTGNLSKSKDFSLVGIQ